MLEEIRKLADFESQNWSTKWLDLAAEADGITWRTLRKKWWQHQIKKDNEDTWAIRHAPGGARDQKLAKAPARAEAAYGATPGPNGLYTCPHCGFSMLLRSLKKHILPCKNLPDDQRALLQARRDQRAAKNHRQPQRPKHRIQQITTQLHPNPATDPIGYVDVSMASNQHPLFETPSGKCVRRNFLLPRPPVGGLLPNAIFACRSSKIKLNVLNILALVKDAL